MRTTDGVVLFAHGARDPDWARPLERIAQALARLRPGCTVRLAFLELMRPSLEEAVAQLAAEGVRRVTVVPAFLGQGGHVRHDLPRLLEATRAAHRSLRIDVHPAIGEQDEVTAAIARAVASRLDAD